MVFSIRKIIIVGVYCDEGTPVPIPNTVVKLFSAENTWREAARENRSTLTSLNLVLMYEVLFFVFVIYLFEVTYESYT